MITYVQLSVWFQLLMIAITLFTLLFLLIMEGAGHFLLIRWQ